MRSFSLEKIKVKLFGNYLELRIRLFNTLACAGIVASVIASITGILTNAGIFNLLINITILVFAILLLRYALTSGNYQRCYVLTILVIFYFLFPAFFLSAGGYNSGMPVYFIFAILFTVFMLEGTKMRLLVVGELVLYSSLILFAYFYPDKITYFDTETDMMVDILISFLIVSIVLGITMSLHIRGYIEQQNELEAARKQAEEYAKMKGELFAGMSHEIRTPLAVVSAYAQFAVEQIREHGNDEQTLSDLATVSEEAKRLSQLADNTLRVLMSGVERGESNDREATPVDMGDLAGRLTQLLKPVAARKGKQLTTTIKAGIPEIHGDAGELTQLLWNILQNAVTHSVQNIELVAEADSGAVKIMVTDDGKGISPDLLQSIFDWGIGGKDGGSGIGLSICRDIVLRHNGDISIDNEEGGGVRVTVTLKGKEEGYGGG
ncbi:MAG: HAMP domain-containing histidine kinase [Lachnospiraceae bacterium]|jgi:signal transduction histidine kinase|nr:HAMP domain-containing histidine kinase [Lachnospiraceae bacterium]